MKREKQRSKYYAIELYPKSDTIQFDKKIDLIKNYDYAYILHNKDTNEPHYHVVVAFNNYRYLNAISDEFDIPSNYIQPIRSLEGMLTYLIHLNDKSKFQYDINEVFGSNSLLLKFQKCIKNNGQEEEDKLYDLLEFIENSDYIKYIDFIKYSCLIGRYDIVRRSQYLFIKIIDEHNNSIYKTIDNNK